MTSRNSVDIVKEELLSEAQNQFLVFLGSCREQLKKKDLQSALRFYLERLPKDLDREALLTSTADEKP